MYLAKAECIQPDEATYKQYGTHAKRIIDKYAEWLTEAGIPYTLTFESETTDLCRANIVLYDRIRIAMYNNSTTFYTDLYNNLVESTSIIAQNYSQPFYSSFEYNFEIGMLVTDASVSFMCGQYVRHSSNDFPVRLRNCSCMTVFPTIRSYADEDSVTFGYTTQSGNIHNLQFSSGFTMAWLQTPSSIKGVSWQMNSLVNSGYDGVAISDFINSAGTHYIPGMIRICNTTPILGKFSDGENTYLGWLNAAARIS